MLTLHVAEKLVHAFSVDGTIVMRQLIHNVSGKESQSSLPQFYFSYNGCLLSSTSITKVLFMTFKVLNGFRFSLSF